MAEQNLLLEAVTEKLYARLSDDRNLLVVLRRIRRRGGNAAGCDGIRPRDLDRDECTALCRMLKNLLRNAAYRPREPRVIQVPKQPPKTGTRPIQINTIPDRVVAGGVYQIINPLFEQTFSDCSYGFRAARGCAEALAEAKRYTLEDHYPIWVVCDIRNAFGNVPRQRLLQILAKRLPPAVVNLIATVFDNGSKHGIAQGNALSPLLLNIYLDHFLDQRWRISWPMLRYVDDVLILCRTHEEAEQAHAQLLRLLDPAGMPIKNREQPEIVDLRQRPVTWLGYTCKLDSDGQFVVTIPSDAWMRLEDRLVRAVRVDSSKRQLFQIMRSWVAQYGPCQELDRVSQLRKQLMQCASHAAPERFIVRRKTVKNWLWHARQRWTKTQNQPIARVKQGPWPSAGEHDDPF